MRADGPWPEDLWERIIGSYNAVQNRLTRSTAALDGAGIPYAVIGAHAVGHWVAQQDDGAVRNTPNVDLLIHPSDYARATASVGGTGFVSVGKIGAHFDQVDGPTGRLYDAVRLCFVAM